MATRRHKIARSAIRRVKRRNSKNAKLKTLRSRKNTTEKKARLNMREMRGGVLNTLYTYTLTSLQQKNQLCKITLKQRQSLLRRIQKWTPEDGYELRFEFDVNNFRGPLAIFVYDFIRYIDPKINTHTQLADTFWPMSLDWHGDYKYTDNPTQRNALKWATITTANDYASIMLSGVNMNLAGYPELVYASYVNKHARQACTDQKSKGTTVTLVLQGLAQATQYIDAKGNVIDKYKTCTIVLLLKSVRGSGISIEVQQLNVLDRTSIPCGETDTDFWKFIPRFKYKPDYQPSKDRGGIVKLDTSLSLDSIIDKINPANEVYKDFFKGKKMELTNGSESQAPPSSAQETLPSDTVSPM